MGIEKTVGKAALELAQNENVVNKTIDFLGMLFLFVGPTDTIVDYGKMIEKYLRNKNTKILEDSGYQVLKTNENQFQVLKTHIDVQVKESSENID